MNTNKEIIKKYCEDIISKRGFFIKFLLNTLNDMKDIFTIKNALYSPYVILKEYNEIITKINFDKLKNYKEELLLIDEQNFNQYFDKYIKNNTLNEIKKNLKYYLKNNSEKNYSDIKKCCNDYYFKFKSFILFSSNNENYNNSLKYLYEYELNDLFYKLNDGKSLLYEYIKKNLKENLKITYNDFQFKKLFETLNKILNDILTNSYDIKYKNKLLFEILNFMYNILQTIIYMSFLPLKCLNNDIQINVSYYIYITSKDLNNYYCEIWNHNDKNYNNSSDGNFYIHYVN